MTTVRGRNTELSGAYVWPDEGPTRVPDWVYTSQEIYDREVARIFRGRTWNYIALEAELPEPGDFKRSFVGPLSVIAVRCQDGSVSVLENRCAHRRVEFCRAHDGKVEQLVCPYHQWTYDLKGNLIGVPFRRGLNKQGGMPPTFCPEKHGLTKLNVATRAGVIFASFAHDVEPLEDYIGPEVLQDFDALLMGRKLRLLGHHDHWVPANWKLYFENIRDPYHTTLLHPFLITFGLMTAGNRNKMEVDKLGRHGAMTSARPENFSLGDETRGEMRRFQPGLKLNDDRIVRYEKENYDSPWTATFETIWPTLIVAQQINTMIMRHLVPQGPNEMIIRWTYFGFEDDSEEMVRQRCRQLNLVGASGLIGLEDFEVMSWLQDGVRKSDGGAGVIEMGAADEGTTSTMMTERAIRSMYRHWRDAMGI